MNHVYHLTYGFLHGGSVAASDVEIVVGLDLARMIRSYCQCVKLLLYSQMMCCTVNKELVFMVGLSMVVRFLIIVE